MRRDSSVRTILLVDEDADEVERMRRAFARREPAIEIAWARDGVEALEKLLGEEGLELPDVILFDVHMPRMDGFELLLRLRSNERTRLVPVVILASSVEERDLVESYRLGANSYMRKPIDYDEFVAAARRLLAAGQAAAAAVGMGRAGPSQLRSHVGPDDA